MDTTNGTMRHRGPSLLALGTAFAGLFVANLVLATVLARGEHFPSPFAPDAADWFSRHRTAVLVGAFLQFGASIPLGIYTATIVSRMQFFGLRVAGVQIALFGGLSASFFLAISALIQWVLAQDGIAVSGVAARTLHHLAFATGGFGHVVPLGLLLAAIAELSSLGLVFPAAMVLLPLARFPALVWMVCAGAMLPDSIERGAR